MTIRIIRNDITKTGAECIVCPSNSKLKEGSGTSYQIYKAAGREVLNKACAKIGYCDLTKSVITSGFNLSKYIIHVVGPVYDFGDEKESKLLSKTYENALKLAYKHNIKTCAIPLLSSGNYGFPKDLSLQISIETISKFLMKHDMDVQLVVYDQESVDCAKKIMPVEEYIDQSYVEETNEDFADEDFLYLFEKEHFPRIFHEQRHNERSLRKLSNLHVESDDTVFFEEAFSVTEEKVLAPYFSARKLEDLMKEKNENFAEMLLRLIDERGLKDSYVYKKANVTKQHFNKIKNTKGYTPRKPTILSLCIAMELSLDETIDLLSKAGQAFSDCSKSDVIVKYYIEHKKYDLNEINFMLHSYHLEPLCL